MSPTITPTCRFLSGSKEIGTMSPFPPEQGTQQHSVSTSDPYRSRVVDGYTDEMKQRLWNGAST